MSIASSVGGRGMILRERTEQWEREKLSVYAATAADSEGRPRQEPPCPARTCFQRDIDRIVHAKSFRRLMHKTQVFLNPGGDHYRTRMIHTLEVSRIARTVARAVALNEDLTEAIALGHDLGHTPFGHAGEWALAEMMPGGFTHYEQSLRVVDRLENSCSGLNLTYETRDGIAHHSGPIRARTLEGQLVFISDRVAYLTADIDDALRAGVLQGGELPREVRERLGERHSDRVNAFVLDLIAYNAKKDTISLSPSMDQIMSRLRVFLTERIYKNPEVKGEEAKARDILQKLFAHYLSHPNELSPDILPVWENEGAERAVCDYIAGMTDRYAVTRFEEIFIPKGWEKT